MSNDQNLPIKFAETVEFVIPPLAVRPEVYINMTQATQAERRLHEAQIVNISTYAELEYVFGNGYRESRNNLTTVGYEMLQTKKMIRSIKSERLIDDYPGFLKEKGLKDSNAMKEAFLERFEEYVAAMDRADMLTALESLIENKVKVFENVSRWMKKEMDATIRSGINSNKY